ncbi:hypothetical protein H6G41_15275 [Tolypothrix sp. FACHB-123]|uniref:hypothetical protein n=1 Tax=Tolypothrix sp. FACHB-123 TaxID=2692868 RepID=UPI00168205DC|nr:hypothetical protein [Tolypothrix sp. FACHB-123]MBD2355966.1 hypothetical protein [Tolypothrix sp. FACHB-123]
MKKSSFISLTAVMLTALTLSSCSTVTTSEYEATALTTYTWRVQYIDEPSPQFETFASTYLLNRNGLKPEGAVTGPDDRGLWWAALPPRPSVGEVEQRQKPQQQVSQPELLKTVDYKITYGVGSQRQTLPTNYDVYREVVKAYPSRIPLELTLGVNGDTVEKAEQAD